MKRIKRSIAEKLTKRLSEEAMPRNIGEVARDEESFRKDQQKEENPLVWCIMRSKDGLVAHSGIATEQEAKSLQYSHYNPHEYEISSYREPFEKKAQVGKFKAGDKVIPNEPIDELVPEKTYTVVDVKEDIKADQIKVDGSNRYYSEWGFSRPYGVSVMAKKAQLKEGELEVGKTYGWDEIIASGHDVDQGDGHPYPVGSMVTIWNGPDKVYVAQHVGNDNFKILSKIAKNITPKVIHEGSQYRYKDGLPKGSVSDRIAQKLVKKADGPWSDFQDEEIVKFVEDHGEEAAYKIYGKDEVYRVLKNAYKEGSFPKKAGRGFDPNKGQGPKWKKIIQFIKENGENAAVKMFSKESVWDAQKKEREEYTDSAVDLTFNGAEKKREEGKHDQLRFEEYTREKEKRSKIAQHSEGLDIPKGRSVEKIIEDIKSGNDDAFGYSHFDVSNMADYSLMSNTIQDMVDCYNISHEDAVTIVQALTHDEMEKKAQEKEDTYKIVRHYKKSGRREIMRKGLSLADAKIWCSREDTHKEGVWFDGFEKEGNKTAQAQTTTFQPGDKVRFSSGDESQWEEEAKKDELKEGETYTVAIADKAGNISVKEGKSGYLHSPRYFVKMSQNFNQFETMGEKMSAQPYGPDEVPGSDIEYAPSLDEATSKLNDLIDKAKQGNKNAIRKSVAIFNTSWNLIRQRVDHLNDENLRAWWEQGVKDYADMLTEKEVEGGMAQKIAKRLAQIDNTKLDAYQVGDKITVEPASYWLHDSMDEEKYGRGFEVTEPTEFIIKGKQGSHLILENTVPINSEPSPMNSSDDYQPAVFKAGQLKIYYPVWQKTAQARKVKVSIKENSAKGTWEVLTDGEFYADYSGKSAREDALFCANKLCEQRDNYKRAQEDTSLDFEVVTSDRNYKTERKVFKTSDQDAPNAGEDKAREYARKLEESDNKDPYGHYRSIEVRRVKAQHALPGTGNSVADGNPPDDIEYEKCPECHGTEWAVPCHTCDGTGQVPKRKVNIHEEGEY